MALIASIDGISRRIYLDASTVGADVHPVDVYKEMRTLRLTDESLRKYELFMRADGNIPKGGGKFTERYVTLLEGTRIVPFDTSHEISVIGTIITDDGQEGIACFDKAPLSVSTNVDINYLPPQVEVITVSVGSGLSLAEQERLQRIEKFVRNRQFTNPASGKIEQYDDTNTTIEYEANIYSDDGVTPYDGTQSINRRDRLEAP